MKKLNIYLILIILLSSLIIAQPPQASQADHGLDIRFPQLQSHKVNQELELHFHLFSKDNGLPLTNADTVICYFHFYNQSNNHISIQNETVFMNNFDMEFTLDENNFTSTGLYSYIVQCECDGCGTVQGFADLGGFESIAVLVSETGESVEEDASKNLQSQTKFYNYAFIFLIYLFGILLAWLGTEHNSALLWALGGGWILSNAYINRAATFNWDISLELIFFIVVAMAFALQSWSLFHGNEKKNKKD